MLLIINLYKQPNIFLQILKEDQRTGKPFQEHLIVTNQKSLKKIGSETIVKHLYN